MEAILWRLLNFCRGTNKSNNHQGNREISTQIKESPPKNALVSAKKRMLTPQKTNMSPKNMIVGRLFSFWNGPFSGGLSFIFGWGATKFWSQMFQLQVEHDARSVVVFADLWNAGCFFWCFCWRVLAWGIVLCCPHPFSGVSMGCLFLRKSWGEHPDLTWWWCGITSIAKKVWRCRV